VPPPFVTRFIGRHGAGPLLADGVV
jgi:hypothetical protein